MSTERKIECAIFDAFFYSLSQLWTAVYCKQLDNVISVYFRIYSKEKRIRHKAQHEYKEKVA